MSLDTGLQLLGGTPSDLDQVRRHPKALDEFTKLQRAAKARYKKLVLELHPDINGNDPAKAHLFNLATQANKWLQELRLEPIKHVRKQITIFVPFGQTVPQILVTVRPRKYDARKVVFLRVD